LAWERFELSLEAQKKVENMENKKLFIGPELWPTYIDWTSQVLSDWAEVFRETISSIDDYEGEQEKEDEESFNYIHSLIDKLKRDKCTEDDYENILFHVWQAKYNNIIGDLNL
jgi:hypothetical protein